MFVGHRTHSKFQYKKSTLEDDLCELFCWIKKTPSLQRLAVRYYSHRIHGTNGIFTYMKTITNQLHLGKYTIHGSYGLYLQHLEGKPKCGSAYPNYRSLFFLFLMNVLMCSQRCIWCNLFCPVHYHEDFDIDIIQLKSTTGDENQCLEHLKHMKYFWLRPLSRRSEKAKSTKYRQQWDPCP